MAKNTKKTVKKAAPKKLKTLTDYLINKSWELKDMTGFQITFGNYDGGDNFDGDFSFSFDEEQSGMASVQAAFETTHVREKFMNKIFPSLYKNKGALVGGFLISNEQIERLEKIFRELGHEVEIHNETLRKNRVWHWLRIKNTSASQIEEQLKQIGEKYETI